jgi:hypothetical protein
LKTRYAGRAEFAWRIALMHPPDFPPSRAQTDGFYPGSGGTVMRSPFRLDSGWLEAERQGHYGAPSLVAKAAREFGFAGDEIRLALPSVGVREGQKNPDLATAVAVAAKAGGKKLPAKKLRDAGSAEFFAHQISRRPSFVLTAAIGDKAVFSGLVRLAPLVATIDAMLADTAAYAAHRAHPGNPLAS